MGGIGCGGLTCLCIGCDGGGIACGGRCCIMGGIAKGLWPSVSGRGAAPMPAGAFAMPLCEGAARKVWGALNAVGWPAGLSASGVGDAIGRGGGLDGSGKP